MSTNTQPETTARSTRAARNKTAPPRINPRPWLINLVGRALRLLAGKHTSCTVPTEGGLDRLTRLSTHSVWNALAVMEFRGWIRKESNFVPGHGKQSAANSYEFTDTFPFKSDYFAAD